MTFEPEEASRDATQAELHERQRQIEEARLVLATPAGRAFVWRILGWTGVYAQTFAGENTHFSAFNEGKRKIGLQLLDECLTVDPSVYSVMRAEGAERSAALDRAVAHELNTRGDLDG